MMSSDAATNTQDPRELDEEIQLVQDAYPKLISTFRDARNGFVTCVKRDSFTGQMENFTSDYELYQSEYGLCFERCVKSILCGDWENYKDYTSVSDVLRSVDKIDVDDVDIVEEFADTWYQYILQLRLLASSDDMVGDTYYTWLPDDVTVFEIEEFLDRIDSQFTNESKILSGRCVPHQRKYCVATEQLHSLDRVLGRSIAAYMHILYCRSKILIRSSYPHVFWPAV